MSDLLPDVAAQTEGFPQRRIQKVGMRNVQIPIFVVLEPTGIPSAVLATFSSYCDLRASLKGINMSRITRTLVEYAASYDRDGFDLLTSVASSLQSAHGTNHIYVKARFPYTYTLATPVTELASPEVAQVTMEVRLIDGVLRRYLTVESVEMSLCPCSKEMSLLINNLTEDEKDQIAFNLPESLQEKIMMAGFGAHNQRSQIRITVEVASSFLWPKELVSIARDASSCPTHTVLKRPDEKWETETSYLGGYFDESGEFQQTSGGPRFVEDIARTAADSLDRLIDKRIDDYVVVVNNEESIHSNEIMATAVITAGRELE